MLAARFSSSDCFASLSEGLGRGVMDTLVSSGRVSASCAARCHGASTQTTGMRGRIATKRRRFDKVCATVSTCPGFDLFQYITGPRKIDASFWPKRNRPIFNRRQVTNLPYTETEMAYQPIEDYGIVGTLRT